MKIEGLNKHYNNLEIFNNFYIDFRSNEITTIIGPSGCGKTTLLRVISGLEEADNNFINEFKEEKLSYIFQEPRLLPWKTAYENLSIPLEAVMDKKSAAETAKKFLSYVKLSEFKNYYPHQLSGGMKQRVAIARAFAYPSDILFMDEPFTGLDHKLKNELMRLFLDLWNENNKTVLFITHCREEARFLSHNIVTLGSDPVSIFNNKRRFKCPV